MGLFQQIAEIVGTATARADRTTILQPLLSILRILALLLVGLAASGAPTWLQAVAAGFVAAGLLLIGWGYVVFSLHNPDALRSERFSLDKMRIERRAAGRKLTKSARGRSLAPQRRSTSGLTPLGPDGVLERSCTSSAEGARREGNFYPGDDIANGDEIPRGMTPTQLARPAFHVYPTAPVLDPAGPPADRR